MFTRTRNLRRLFLSFLVAFLALTATVVVTAPTASAVTCQPSPHFGGSRWGTSVPNMNFPPGGWCITGNQMKMLWQSDGNLVIYPAVPGKSYPAVWATNTAGHGRRLSFQQDGNMVVYDANNRAVFASGQYPHWQGMSLMYLLELNRTNDSLGTGGQLVIVGGQTNNISANERVLCSKIFNAPSS